jgi:predicted metal-binding membrane protein
MRTPICIENEHVKLWSQTDM